MKRFKEFTEELNEAGRGPGTSKAFAEYLQKLRTHLEKVTGTDYHKYRITGYGKAESVLQSILNVSKEKDFPNLYTGFSAAKTEADLLKVLKGWIKTIKAN